MKRTVFSGAWSLKFAGALHADNSKRFPDTTGDHTDQCAFNWKGDDEAEVIAGKMEATFTFDPLGISWSARGVTFTWSEYGGGTKFDCRLHREAIRSRIAEPSGLGDYRSIYENDANWEFDGDSDLNDAKYPHSLAPNRAFRIDWPGFNPDPFDQCAQRGDLREIMQWHNGSQWSTFTRSNTWFINATAVKPDGTEGGSNSTGQGTAENIPNARPTANAGPDQCKVKNTTVTLDGSKSSDSDVDVIWAYAWTQQPGGTPVTLDDPTSESPSFTAPSAPTTLTFDLKVKDVTMGFYYHRPTNYESFPDSVIVQVVNKQSDCKA